MKYTVEIASGVSLRSEPRFEAKLPSKRGLPRGTTVHVRLVKENWVQLKDGTWLPIRGPNQQLILLKNESSDDRTTAYMENFKDGLQSLGHTQVDSDPYIAAYTNPAPAPRLLSTVSRLGEMNAIVPGIVSMSLEESWRCNVSDRPLFCMTLKGDEVVAGGADHGLHVVSMKSKKRLRQLYGKTCGHTEWVTSATHVPGRDIRIISGGMDGQLCFWTGNSCRQISAHAGSVSRVRAAANVVASSGYDRSVKLWDTRSLKPMAVLTGHTGAVIDFVWDDDRILSSGRDSLAKLWDVHEARELLTFRGHSGHVTTSLLLGSVTCATGAQDGNVRIWDTRVGNEIARLCMHAKGAAISELGLLAQGDLVSCGADGRVNVIDPRNYSTAVRSWEGDHSNFIYSMRCFSNGTIATGGGDGKLVCRDSSGAKVVDLQLETNAIRCIDVADGGQVAVCGDDGNVIVLNN